MSFCTIATVAANKAVIAPTHATTVLACSDTSRNTCARTMRNTPAVTIVAAWMSAETGVGPSIASGSQMWSGTCALLPIAPTNSKQRDRGDGRLRELRRGRAHRGVVERADLREDQEHREHEAEVADAVGDERLLARDRGRVALEPERDQQVRAQADALPPEEGQQEARAEHEHEHRGREQVEVREEPAEARVAVHVPDRVQVDQRADAGDEQDHRRRERIDEEAEVDAEAARLDPREAVAHVVRAPPRAASASARNITTDATNASAISPVASQPGERLADALAEQQEHHRAERRDGGNHPREIEEIASGHPRQPLSAFKSSAVT